MTSWSVIFTPEAEQEFNALKWTPLSRQLLVEFKVVPLRLLVTG